MPQCCSQPGSAPVWGALTKDRPKPLIEVAGRPLIDHALDLVKDLDPVRTVANLHYHADQLAAHLGPKGVLLSREDPEILETGGGLRAALPMLGADPVFTLNTDAIWSGPNPLTLLQKAWDPSRMDALLMCVPVARTVGHIGSGDFTAGKGWTDHAWSRFGLWWGTDPQDRWIAFVLANYIFAQPALEPDA